VWGGAVGGDQFGAKIAVCVNFFSLSEHKFTQTAIMTQVCEQLRAPGRANRHL
jgi:hypothetical protein